MVQDSTDEAFKHFARSRIRIMIDGCRSQLRIANNELFRIIVGMQRETMARMFNEIQEHSLEHNLYRTNPDLLTLLRNIYLFTDSGTN